MTIVEDAAQLETPEELDDFHAYRACIRRGSKQIGGTCIELASGDARILLDLGLPLDAGDMDPKTLLPPIKGLHEPDPYLFGIVISHGHADHWGVAPYVDLGNALGATLPSSRQDSHAVPSEVTGSGVYQPHQGTWTGPTLIDSGRGQNWTAADDGSCPKFRRSMLTAKRPTMGITDAC